MPGVPVPPDHAAKVLNARLQSDGVDISATDWVHPTCMPRPRNMLVTLLRDISDAELEVIFAKHADPDLLDAPVDLPFGTYAHLADRYGVHWFVLGERREPA
jgi:PhnB protein